MKRELYFVIIGILFPIIIKAQLCIVPGETTKHHQQHSILTLSKNSSQVLFPAALAGYYREDFEGTTFPPPGWQMIDLLNPLYEWRATDGLKYNGVQSAYIGFDAANMPGEDWLILPQYTVESSDSLSFRLALENTGYSPDSTFILISTTDSSPSSFTSVLATLTEGINYPTVDNVFHYYSYSLSAYAGTAIYVAIINKNTNGDGVYIDRVEIGIKPPLNAAVVSLNLPGIIQTGAIISPSAVVLNDGNSDQSFPVIMTTQSGYSSVINVTNLAPGATQQITFEPWTAPGGASLETVSVQTQLVGDGFAEDDALSDVIKVLEPFGNHGWTSKAPVTPLKWGVPLASINTHDSTYLFTMGGDFGYNNYSNQARKYLPNNAWASHANLNVPAAYACGASYNNKVYVVGGYTSSTNLTDVNRIYDVATNAWSFGAPIPISTGHYAMGIYHDSLFYYMGGFGGSAFLTNVQIYNAASDTWTIGSDLPQAYGYMSGGITGNKIIISGGYFNGEPIANTYLGEIDQSDPTNITWTQVEDYPAGGCVGLAGGASLDQSSGLIVFTGGALNNELPLISSEYTFAYDVNANQWKIGPPKTTPANNLMNLVPLVFEGNLYMVSIGGFSDSIAVNVNEWLDLGQYAIPTGVSENESVNTTITSYPNPFVEEIEIKFSLSKSSKVKTVVVDLLGQEVEVLCNTILEAGTQLLHWDASKFTSGVYFCKLIVEDTETTQKLVKN